MTRGVCCPSCRWPPACCPGGRSAGTAATSQASAWLPAARCRAAANRITARLLDGLACESGASLMVTHHARASQTNAPTPLRGASQSAAAGERQAEEPVSRITRDHTVPGKLSVGLGIVLMVGDGRHVSPAIAPTWRCPGRHRSRCPSSRPARACSPPQYSCWHLPDPQRRARAVLGRSFPVSRSEAPTSVSHR